MASWRLIVTDQGLRFLCPHGVGHPALWTDPAGAGAVELRPGRGEGGEPRGLARIVLPLDRCPQSDENPGLPVEGLAPSHAAERLADADEDGAVSTAFASGLYVGRALVSMKHDLRDEVLHGLIAGMREAGL